jgi:hypothetical protein
MGDLVHLPARRFSTRRALPSPVVADISRARHLASLERQSSEARARGIWWPPGVRKIEVVR